MTLYNINKVFSFDNWYSLFDVHSNWFRQVEISSKKKWFYLDFSITIRKKKWKCFLTWQSFKKSDSTDVQDVDVRNIDVWDVDVRNELNVEIRNAEKERDAEKKRDVEKKKKCWEREKKRSKK